MAGGKGGKEIWEARGKAVRNQKEGQRGQRATGMREKDDDIRKSSRKRMGVENDKRIWEK